MEAGVDRPVRAGVSIGWTGLALAALAAAGAAWTSFVVSVSALLARHRTPAQPVMLGLEQLGLSTEVYAGYHGGLLITFAVLCTTVAGVVVWRRRREPMAWLVALFLVLVGTVNAPSVEALAWRHPRLEFVASTANLVLIAALVAMLVTFPDGRAVPRWGAPVAVAAVGVLVATGWGLLGEDLPGGWFLLLVLTVLGGLAAQVHRYRRVSDWERRQQTKWVVAATGIAVLAQVVMPVLASLPMLTEPGTGALLGELLGVTGVTAGFAVLAVSLGLAVLRHRLWAADVVVNRTLVYGALTFGTLALYTALVAAAHAVLGSWAELGSSAVVAVAVAVLFAPTRDRIQRRVNRSLYGQRDEPYRVLSDLGRQLHLTAESSVLQKLVETVAAALKLPYVALSVNERGDATLAETGTRRDDLVPFPLLYQGTTVGTLLVAPRSPNEPFNQADRVLLEDLAVQAGAAAAAVRLSDQVQQARQQRVLALEEERRRLRRDLHDGLGPALASMTLQAELARDLLQDTPEQAERLLDELTHQLQASTAEIRRVVYGLRPPALDDLGLSGALQSYLATARASGLAVKFTAAADLPPLTAAVEVAAYRIVQESLTNIVRHAGATACRVAMGLDGDALVVEVEDDGIGLTASDHHGIGLLSMRERAAELGGSCSVTERPGGGVRVRAQLPHAAVRPPERA